MVEMDRGKWERIGGKERKETMGDKKAALELMPGFQYLLFHLLEKHP